MTGREKPVAAPITPATLAAWDDEADRDARWEYALPQYAPQVWAHRCRVLIVEVRRLSSGEAPIDA